MSQTYASTSPIGNAATRDPSNVHPYELRLYKRRFFVLLVYSLGNFFNAFAFVQYSVIADVMTMYFDVSNMAINITSIVFTIGFIVAMVPTIWIFERKGLKFGLIMGLGGNALGFCIKCVGVSPNLFWLTMVGQTVIAISQCFFLTTSPHVAAVWFGSNEVSRATAAGVFSNSVGVAVCGLISPMIVNGKTIAAIHDQLGYMMYSEAGISVLLFLTAVLFMPINPEHPPSKAQAQLLHTKASVVEPGILSNFKTVIRKPGFVPLVIAFSINYSVMFVLATVFNQMILDLYPGSTQDVGNMVLLLQLTSVFGTVFAGVLLDKTHKYKEISVVSYLIGVLTVGAFTGVIYISIVYIYVVVSLIGFFVGGFITVGLDLGVEMSYPISEISSLGLAGILANIIILIQMFLCSAIIELYGALPTNLILLGSSIIGFIFLSCTKIRLHRYTASQAIDLLVTS